MVSARGAPPEPFHRWIHYKQGFSPGLVRLFLQEQAGRFHRPNALPLLDPFAGSGTVTIECARRGVPAIGVEALASLAFLANARSEREMPPWPEALAREYPILGGTRPAQDGMPALKPGMLKASQDMAAARAAMPPERRSAVAIGWESIADRLTHPLHRAALMLAVGRRHTSSGRLNRGADPFLQVLDDVLTMIREDLLQPLTIANVVHEGDARCLTMIDDQSIGGILTSPPYISRHDYASIAAPYERVYRHWFPPGESNRPRETQMAGRVKPGASSRAAGFSPRGDAHPPRAAGFSPRDDAPPRRAAGFSPRDERRFASGTSVPDPAREAADQLEAIGERKLAAEVRAYFVDLAQVLSECHRVLAPGGICWMVIGGARLKDVHIPSDIIVAEQAESIGFDIETVRVAREVTNSRRKFGRIGHIAPRESVIVVTKR